MTQLYDPSNYAVYIQSLTNRTLSEALTQTRTTGLPITTVTANSANTANTTGNATPVASSTGAAVDDRVRISHLAGYNPGGGGATGGVAGGAASGGGPYTGIQAPLKETGGLMFPYTPSIQISQDVDYGVMQMVHSNTDYHYFNRSPNASVNITGKFTVQNQYEGRYAIACLQFLRTVSKMNFGQKDQFAGLPPPILALSGHGTYMFNKVRVFVKTHSYNYDENMDIVDVKLDSGNVKLPAMFTLSVSLTTQPTPNMMRTEFTLEEYRSGALLAKGGWL